MDVRFGSLQALERADQECPLCPPKQTCSAPTSSLLSATSRHRFSLIDHFLARKEWEQIQASLLGFEPQTKSQEALHEAALQQFNTFYEYRRARLYSVTSGIPAVMWYTVAIGAFINILLILLFDLRLGIHLLLGGILSFFLATLISLVVLMDHPFRGEMSVSPAAFQLVFDQLMKQ